MISTATVFPFQGLSALDHSILESLVALARHISNKGYSCRAYSEKSLHLLAALPEEKKRATLAQLQILIQIIMQSEFENPSPDVSNDHPEKGLLEKALEFYNFELRDDFWKLLEKEDIVEIYNLDEIQIFRTLNFFKTCAYSLADLITNEWFMLWERPSFVIERMIETSRGYFSGKNEGIQKMPIPQHVLREIYSESMNGTLPESRSVLLEFG